MRQSAECGPRLITLGDGMWRQVFMAGQSGASPVIWRLSFLVRYACGSSLPAMERPVGSLEPERGPICGSVSERFPS